MAETYNMPEKGLFGKRCKIQHVCNMKDGFVYRIVNSGIRSNSWKELPLGRCGKSIWYMGFETNTTGTLQGGGE